MEHFADRLVSAARAKGNSLCVGLDPRWESLPHEIRSRHPGNTLDSVAQAYEEFCSRVIDVVAPLVAVVKPQSAFFEACGPAGLVALQHTIRRARSKGLLTIWDSKRNDIADTAAAYADAAFAGFPLADQVHPIWDADAMTLNAYLGADSLEPFLDRAQRHGRGVFILVRTSNRGAHQFQDLQCQDKPLWQHVAHAVGKWAAGLAGRSGWSSVGAVIGATYPAELAAVRTLLPNVPFLIPGLGAQGAAAAAVAPAFTADGLGAVVNSSRGIIFSYDPSAADWEAAVEKATRSTIQALAEATSMKHLAEGRQAALA